MLNIDNFSPAPLPAPYAWVRPYAERLGPNIMREALKNHGLTETRGQEHTPEILDMAAYLGGVIADFYTADEIPWCGLAVSYWIKKAGFEPPRNYSQVRARDFSTWGAPVVTPSFGDVLSFWRGSRDGRDGHVGLYVKEDETTYHVYGGNQRNAVNITRLSKNRLIAARRCPWRIKQPKGVKPFLMADNGGIISENEA